MEAVVTYFEALTQCIHLGTGAPFPGVKRPGYEPFRSPPSIAKVKNV
jgi:hypothetical protein